MKLPNLIFLAVVLIFFVVCYQNKKPDKIICNCERGGNNFFEGAASGGRLSETHFNGYRQRTDHAAHSGKFSILVTKEAPYGMSYLIKNIKPREQFSIKVWRHISNSSANVVVEADDINKLYLAQHNSNGLKEDEWEQLTLDFIVPTIARNENIQIFVFNPGTEKPAYFDDLEILYRGINTFNHSDLEIEFKDERDGKIYKAIKIGNDYWMSENLSFKTDKESYCYSNDEELENKYGRLYSWKAAHEGVPKGWVLPSDNDWKKLEKFLGMPDSTLDNYGNRGTDIAIKMKDFGESGFDAKLVGIGGDSIPPGFYDLFRSTCFWTSTEIDTTHAWCREIGQWADIGRFKDNKEMKFSVRCIMKKIGYE